jgi:CubicO group peptidase (beta-lactamase class C family)
MSRIFDHQHLVDRIHGISGAPGIAIGVYHQGHVVYEDYRGLRDVEANLPVDRDTIFHVASLIKAITAIAVGILVDRGDL